MIWRSGSKCRNQCAVRVDAKDITQDFSSCEFYRPYVIFIGFGANYEVVVNVCPDSKFRFTKLFIGIRKNIKLNWT